MKIISYNIRGIGSIIKKREVQELIRKFKPVFCCIQETKLEGMSAIQVKSIWGGDRVNWMVRNSEGRSGGILSMWDPDIFSCLSSWEMPGAVIVNGFWGPDRKGCCIINVYAPNDSEGRADLWDRILCVIQQSSNDCVCILGDFNAIRSISERRGRSLNQNRKDMDLFDGFIRDAQLLDLPLNGRNYTCYKADGTCKSRIDRVLVNNGWLDMWPSVSLKGLQRSVSDHCPLLLDSESQDWGPKPFRFINAWCSHPKFREVIENTWNSHQVQGWGGFVVKEKLKYLKGELKKWNREVFGLIDKNVGEIKEKIHELDMIDEVGGLDENMIIQRKEMTAELFRKLHQKGSLNAQKAKIRWLREGDVNSSFFHRAINFRRKINEIPGIMIDGMWREEVSDVKNGCLIFSRISLGALGICRQS